MSPPSPCPPPLQQLRARFADLADPRVERTKDHQLLDILTITICAVLCGADNWVDIEAFGHAKRAFLERFLLLPNGIPSHDTFGRVFARLNPDQFSACFRAWVQDLIAASGDQLRDVVALDGKCLCGSRATEQGKGPLYLVSAWATANHLVLGQVAVDEKSNEITAIPALLKLLELTGCVVTIDAMGCQTAIAAQIVAADADYVLALKGNHSTLHQDVQLMHQQAQRTQFRHLHHQRWQPPVEKDHGRLETRRYWLVDDPAYLRYLDPTGAWVGVRGIGIVQAERQVGGVTTTETRYYLTSLTSVRELAQAVRGHWGIENRVHWVLDVAFREDDNRTRSGDSAQNLSGVRQLALNLLRQDSAGKGSIKTKRLRAGWDDGYLLKVLRG
jgi:predicted transposase YbfD/YdcC